MKISYNALLEFAALPYAPAQTADILTMLGIEVDAVEYQRARYENFFIGEILATEKHRDAKKLSVCEVTVGGASRRIICGAPNVAAGQRVIVALPGSVVPSNGLEIGERVIRGEHSSGMICSKAELGIADESDGIWVLPDDAPVGLPLADYLGENDVIFDVSLTANRADCLSHIGIARDLAAFAGIDFKVAKATVPENKALRIENSLSAEISDTEKCPRYATRIIRDVSIGESPEWLCRLLISLGFRPRNIAVDVTNYVMARCGQPLHAFDYDKIAQGKIIVQTARNGEKFITLDGKERILDEAMTVICDAEKPIAIAGVMGGKNSEITDETTVITLESAYFQPSSIRRTAKKLGLSTDASHRFERGVDYGANILYALDLAAAMIAELGGGSVDAGCIDLHPAPIARTEITLRYRRATELLGVDIAPPKMRDFIVGLGFEIVSETESELTVNAPTWRVDMDQEIDLIEEIARLYFYDEIEPSAVYTAPNTTETAADFTSPKMREIIRNFLAHRGFNQIYCYNFTDAETASLNGETAIATANPLGEEFAVLRTSALPSMLRVISGNIRVGAESMALFETGRIFRAAMFGSRVFTPGIEERETIVFALSGNIGKLNWSVKSRAADFYDAKGAAEELFEYLGIAVTFRPVENPPDGFTPNSVIAESMSANGEVLELGITGEISAYYRERYDIQQPVFCAVFDANALYRTKVENPHYEKISPFPEAERDVAFVLDTDISAGALLDVIHKAGGEFFRSASVFDIFSGTSLGEGKKSAAVRLKFVSSEKTLTEAEISASMQSVVKSVATELGGFLRS